MQQYLSVGSLVYAPKSVLTTTPYIILTEKLAEMEGL